MKLTWQLQLKWTEVTWLCTYWWFPLTWCLSSCSTMKSFSYLACPPPTPEDIQAQQWKKAKSSFKMRLKMNHDERNRHITFHFPFSLAFLMTLFIISVKLRKHQLSQHQKFCSFAVGKKKNLILYTVCLLVRQECMYPSTTLVRDLLMASQPVS